MSIGYLNFAITKPGYLDFGGSGGVDNNNELTINVTLAPPSGGFSFFIGFRLTKTIVVRQQGTKVDRQECAIAYNGALQQWALWNLAMTDGKLSVVNDFCRLTSGTPIFQQFTATIQDGLPIIKQDSLSLEAGSLVANGAYIGSVDGKGIESTVFLRWGTGTHLFTTFLLSLQNGLALRYCPAIPLSDGWIDPRTIQVVWDQGKPVPHGWRIPIIPPLLPSKAWGRLNFNCPKPSSLDFGNLCFGSSGLLVPVQRSYRVINSAALIRVSDNADIPVSNLTVGLDIESWCWTLSATLLGRTAYETVPAANGLVQATINGFVWRFVVDEVDYTRAFGSFGGQLSGRSPIALLAEPYTLKKSYWETSLRTAQQLMLQELPEGFSLTITLPDWTIPAGVFKYENLTRLEVLLLVAKSCGGRLYAHKTDQTVYAVPKWPRKPWEWTLSPADVTLPSSYTLKEQLKQQDGHEYEAVMVSGGVDNGIVAICKRTGTGGTTYAPSVVDTLIVHLDAATPRAVQELADHWPMKRYTLELPLQATPQGAGLIEPGIVLDFTDGAEDGWRGLVVGVSINASWNSVTQTLEIVAP